jgi:hypothetical protein
MTAGDSGTAIEPSSPSPRIVTYRFGMEIMPRKSIGETAMTDAERQARYRAARAAGKPVIRVRRALDHRGRARRWNDNVAGLVEGQVEYAAWLDSLPENLQDSALAEALQAICDLDLSELQAIIPPRGFGRD